MKHRQREWRPAGWRIMLTWGQSFGLGFYASGSWFSFRCNGVDILFGPLVVTVVPPTPRWMIDEINQQTAERAMR